MVINTYLWVISVVIPKGLDFLDNRAIFHEIDPTLKSNCKEHIFFLL